MAKDLEKLKLAPALPDTLSDGGLKKLEFELGYEPPEPILRRPPNYPKRQARKGQDGVVDISFMVSKDGDVFEAIVIDSTHPDFEPQAIEAVQKYKYKPGSLDGQPIDSSTKVRIWFQMRDSADAAGWLFFRLYKKTDKLLRAKKPDQKAIRRNLHLMADADSLSGYSLAYLYLMEHRYANKFLGKQEQLYALRKLLFFQDSVNEKNKFLDLDTIKTVRMNILQLLIQLGYYGEARSNYYWLKKEMPDAAERFTKPMSEVYKRLKDGIAISRPIKILDRGHDFLYLTKRSFEIHDVVGKIEKLNFYCSQRFGAMDFVVGSNYQVPESWGSCDLQIVGESQTTGMLYQF
ncbi:MAG: TonB family protein [Arenicella sp.]|nr:TonB family protein [Arenicella sp.]